MSTTEETNNIDEKKGSSTTSIDFKEFAKNYIFSIVFTIGIAVFIIGTCGLYTSKIAQANILPDNHELAPYTIFDRVVESIPIDINVMRPHFFSDNKNTFSQNAYFNSQDYLDSFKNSFLNSLRKTSEPTSGIFSNISLFFSNVFDNIIAKNFLFTLSSLIYFH